MDNLFDFFGDALGNLPVEPHLINNYKDARTIELIRSEREKTLSPFAMRTDKSRGRIHQEEPCAIRSPYERDLGRIIFSQSFRRLRHKTQVFFNPVNDHICSRIEHVIYVNYISTIIGRCLNLNIDLIQAIALGHDIGHSPYGHTGERVLNKCIKSVDPSLFFEHEVHSLRVLDVLEEHRPNEYGLNLTFEVRDGIVVSCSRTGGKRGWQLYSVSRWSAEDGRRLRSHLELEFEQKKNRQIYWDDVALFCHPGEYQLGIRPMQKSDIIEIDTLEELAAADPSYACYMSGSEEKYGTEA